MTMKRGEKGFTMMELIITMAIIGILAAIIMVNLNSSRRESRDVKRLADIQEIILALHLFFNDNNTYPNPDTPSVSGPSPSEGDPVWTSYIVIWPQAPLPPDNPSGVTDCTEATNAYTYSKVASGQDFNLTFCLGSTVAQFGPGIHTASVMGIQ